MLFDSPPSQKEGGILCLLSALVKAVAFQMKRTSFIALTASVCETGAVLVVFLLAETVSFFAQPLYNIRIKRLRNAFSRRQATWNS